MGIWLRNRAAFGLFLVAVIAPVTVPAANEDAPGRVADAAWYVRAVLSAGDEVNAGCGDGSRGGEGEQTGFFAFSISDERIDPVYRHPTQGYFHLFTGRSDVAADVRVLDMRVRQEITHAPVFDPGPPGPTEPLTAWALADRAVLRVAWAQWNAAIKCAVTVNGRPLTPQSLANERARRLLAGDFEGGVSASAEQLVWTSAGSSAKVRIQGFALAMLLDDSGSQFAVDGSGTKIDSDPPDDPVLAIASKAPGLWSFELPASHAAFRSPPLVLVDFPD